MHGDVSGRFAAASSQDARVESHTRGDHRYNGRRESPLSSPARMLTDDRLLASIVIPAYNEERRLPATLAALEEALAGDRLAPLAVGEVVVVDDGSADRTADVTRSFAARLPRVSVVSLGENRGKGRAVREGLRAAAGPWVLVADADLSTPWEEAARLAVEARLGGAAIAIGSRGLDMSRIKVHQSIVRESLGRTFNAFLRLVTGLPFSDTQCGFKLVEKPAIAAVLPRLSVDHFAWDVELLLRARQAGLVVREVSVEWSHQADSRVRVLRDGLRMVATVLALRLGGRRP